MQRKLPLNYESMCVYRVGACVCVRVCVSLYGGCKCECVRMENGGEEADSHRLVEYLRQYLIIHSSVFSTSFKRTSSKNCCFYNPDFREQNTSLKGGEPAKASFLRSSGSRRRHSPCSGIRSAAGGSCLLTGNR